MTGPVHKIKPDPDCDLPAPETAAHEELTTRLVIDFASQLGLAPSAARVKMSNRPLAFGARGMAGDGLAEITPTASTLPALLVADCWHMK